MVELTEKWLVQPETLEVIGILEEAVKNELKVGDHVHNQGLFALVAQERLSTLSEHTRIWELHIQLLFWMIKRSFEMKNCVAQLLKLNTIVNLYHFSLESEDDNDEVDSHLEECMVCTIYLFYVLY